MRVTCRMSTFAMLALLVAPLRGAVAQAPRRELVGVVRDQAGAPVEGATVQVRGASARTDAKGAFALWTGPIDTVTLSVRRLGYVAVSALLTARNQQWDTVLVDMERTAQRLTGVEVAAPPTRRALALRDFEERRAKGNGVFITREEIAEHNTSRLSDILRTKRGVSIVKIRNGYYGVRFVAYTGKGAGTCAPEIFLDGQRARGMEIDDLLTHDIEAMELYENWSTTPFQFTSQNTTDVPCGSIVIWTRVPGGKAP